MYVCMYGVCIRCVVESMVCWCGSRDRLVVGVPGRHHTLGSAGQSGKTSVGTGRTSVNKTEQQQRVNSIYWHVAGLL